MTDSELLHNIRLFEEMNPEECGRIAALLTERPYAQGQSIVHEGHAGDYLFIVKSGLVRVTRAFGDSTLTIATLHSCDHFGEMALIDEHPHSATVTADQDCVILQLSRADLQKLLGESESIKAKFWRAIALELTRRIRSTTNTMRDYVGINKALCENEKFREFYVLCNSH